MEQKKCKKCGKPLPEDYNKKYCEHCQNEWIHPLKPVIYAIPAAAVGLATWVIKRLPKK